MGRHKGTGLGKKAAALLPVALALVLAAGCGKSNLLQEEGGGLAANVSVRAPSGTPAGVGKGGHPLALAEAKRLMLAVHVPVTPLPLGRVPRSSPIRFAPGIVADPNQVDLHRVWRLRAGPQAVLAAVRRNHPGGLRVSGGGSAGKHSPGQPEVEDWWYVTFEASSLPGLGEATLSLSMAAASGGGTLLRADADVIWLDVRPAAERVPDGVSGVEVIRGRPERAVTLRRTISDPSSVQRIDEAIDALPIVQPGDMSCPEEPAEPAVVHLIFRGASGTQLAVATQSAGPEVGGCDPMHFSVMGRDETPLANGSRVLAIGGQALGVRLLPG